MSILKESLRAIDSQPHVGAGASVQTGGTPVKAQERVIGEGEAKEGYRPSEATLAAPREGARSAIEPLEPGKETIE